MMFRQALRAGTGLRRLGYAVLLTFIVVSPVSAQDERPLRGVALIIGQSDYEHLSSLANPSRDADAIEELLGDFGFDTTLVTDRDASRLARTLERFLEDAEEADMAVVYYAGHGIEVAGQNYLVPVDADLSALQALEDHLIPLSPFMERLQQTVPLAVIMLDACRDNPFPEGALARASTGSEAVPVTASGLGEHRGARRLALPAQASDNFGTVIGYAAEPGKVALDGPAGENSPYAAALLRHLGAMQGEEFGTVMRMVAEEVYLKTSGRQRPWVNENLRRLLYFGRTPDAPDGAEGDILRERRQLLVSIAALPTAQRARAETLAEAGGVSMSVVYAMMQALGVDKSASPDTVENRLRTQIEQFAALREARIAFESADPEIARLTALADSAEEEGALSAADDLREQAKSRVASLRETRADQIETLRRRIVEDADVYARSAETKKLMFRHAAAADDYAEAAAIVAQWDAPLAGTYRLQEIAARLADAELKGSSAALDATEVKARSAVASVSDPDDPLALQLRHTLALILMLRSERNEAVEPLQQAAALLEQAVARAELLPPAERVRLMLDAGRATARLASVDGDQTRLAQVGDLFTRAGKIAAENDLRPQELEARFLRFQSLYVRWTTAPDEVLFAESQAEIVAIIELLGHGEPDAFSARYLSKGILVAVDFAQRLNTPEAFYTAMEMTGAALEVFDAERFPLIVAEIDTARGRIATEAADRFKDYSAISTGISNLRNAVRIYEQTDTPVQLTESKWSLALALAAIGVVEFDTHNLAESVSILADLKDDDIVTSSPTRLQALSYHLARLDGELAARQGDEQRLRAAIAVLADIYAGLTASDLIQRMQTENQLGRLHFRLAGLTDSADAYRASVDWLDFAFAHYTEANRRQPTPLPDSYMESLYADAAAGLALKSDAVEDIERAIDANEKMIPAFRSMGSIGGIVHTANIIAILVTREIETQHRNDNYRIAYDYLMEAMVTADDRPNMVATLQGTQCGLVKAQAVTERDIEQARSAIELCRTATHALTPLGEEQAETAARRNMKEARALVRELERP